MKFSKRLTLPKERGKYGYTEKQLQMICRREGIKMPDFWKTFGDGHTCAVDDNGDSNFYATDVLGAFRRLGINFCYKGD